MIFLASPYRANLKENGINYDMLMRERVIVACQRAADLARREGKIVFCAVAHFSTIHRHDCLYGEDVIRTQALGILKECSELYVMKLLGWDTSEGVTAEIEFAAAEGIPIEFIF